MVTQCNTDVPEARMQPVDHLVDKGSYQRDAYLFYWIFWNDKGKFLILTTSPSLKMFFWFPGTLEVINGMEEVPICESQAQRLMKYSGIWKGNLNWAAATIVWYMVGRWSEGWDLIRELLFWTPMSSENNLESGSNNQLRSTNLFRS